MKGLAAMSKLDELKKEVLDEVKANIADGYNREDTISEVIDQSIPVYTSELIALAAEHSELVTESPDIWGFDGKHTPLNGIAGNLYDLLYQHCQQNI